jgi:hypothetical protein
VILAQNPVVSIADAFSAGWSEGCRKAFDRMQQAERSKLRSRGFDKRLTRKMDGTVVPRKAKTR